MKYTISLGEIERRYKKLMEDVKTNEYYKIDLTNRVNCYGCEKCLHVTKTKDVDAGVTPALFTCENCGELAASTFYRDIRPLVKPTFEWYRPTLQETLKLRKKPANLDHVLNGGLNYRQIKPDA